MSFLIYILIVVVKTFEVTLTTLRIKLITKGEKVKGALTGFVEVSIWIVLVSTVLKDVASDPYKIIAYATGFALGNYFGVELEDRLGLGTVRVEVIVKEEHGIELAKNIRSYGYAVTVIEGKGMNFNRHVLIMVVQRKREESLIKIIKEFQQNAFITILDTKPIYGGFGALKK